MGKDNLILGTARGKLGDVVFYRTGGEQRFRTRVKPMNPRTNSQLLQRTVVSTVVKAYSELIEVCDHAFQGFEGKAKNHQRWMRLNIMKFREVALKNVLSFSPMKFTSTHYGNWVTKDSMDIIALPLIISEGSLNGVNMSFYERGTENIVNGPGFDTLFLEKYNGKSGVYEYTYQDMVDVLGINPGDQLTFIAQTAWVDGFPMVRQTFISRVIMMPSNGDMSTNFFTNDGDGTHHVNMPNVENEGDIYFTTSKKNVTDEGYTRVYWAPTSLLISSDNIISAGVIQSRYEQNMWRRSNSEMSVRADIEGKLTLQNAIESFEKSTTSSLYLNQATTEEKTSAYIDLMKSDDEVANVLIDDSQEITESEKNERRKARRNEE